MQVGSAVQVQEELRPAGTQPLQYALRPNTAVAPAAVAIEGGSFGLQLASTDVIMLVMKDSGMNEPVPR